MTEEQILERIAELVLEIEDHKRSILLSEPSLPEIWEFVEREHPKKQEQRDYESQMRTAQNEIADLRDLLENP